MTYSQRVATPGSALLIEGDRPPTATASPIAASTDPRSATRSGREERGHRSNGYGTLKIDRLIPGIGRICRASGTHDYDLLQDINTAITALQKARDYETLGRLKDGSLRPLALLKRSEEYRRHRREAPALTIYVIRPESGLAVKIGITQNLDKRLRMLRTGTYEDLTVVWSGPGNLRIEQALHERFAAYRLQGEWFRLEGEVLEWVESLTR